MYIKVDLNKLNLLLLLLGIFLYYKIYWGCYSFVIFKLLDLKLELINILDMIFIVFFVLSVVPCSFAIRYLTRTFLSK